jgi:hypothetical protein
VRGWGDLQRSLLAEAHADRLRFIEAFGILIGNTDRHYGSISLLIANDDWRLARQYRETVAANKRISSGFREQPGACEGLGHGR